MCYTLGIEFNWNVGDKMEIRSKITGENYYAIKTGYRCNLKSEIFRGNWEYSVIDSNGKIIDQIPYQELILEYSIPTIEKIYTMAHNAFQRIINFIFILNQPRW